MTIVFSKIGICHEKAKMVVVTNKPLDPESKVKSKPEEPENVVRITENPLSAKPYMKVDPPPIQIRDEDEAQRFLVKAWESRNYGEVLRCLEYLTRSVDDSPLEKVIELFRKFEPYKHEIGFEPSAPIYDDMDQLIDDADQKINDHLCKFNDRCLDRFDANANDCLKRTDLLATLTYNQLHAIVKRDTFAVTNETHVYCACVHWAQAQCHNKCTDIRLGNVMKDLKYAPRYGLMSLGQFCQPSIDGVTGMKRGGVLSEAEYKEYKKYIKGKARGKKVDELKNKLSEPRQMGTNQRMSVSSERTKWEKCFMYTLICFTAVFD